MKIIVFSEESAAKQRLIDVAHGADLDEAPDVYVTSESFINRLRQPVLSHTIAIIYAHNRSTLEKLLTDKHIIQDIKTIIVLSDAQMRTIVTAHLFHPRFVIFEEDIAEKLPPVITKMCGNMAVLSWKAAKGHGASMDTPV